MKFKSYLKAALMLTAVAGLSSCNDYLDKEPLSDVSPEKYFNDEASLQNYCNKIYQDVISTGDRYSYGIYQFDEHSDNMASMWWDEKYIPGRWKTSMTDDDNWKFENINSINYFFDTVLPKYEADQISGNKSNVDHYIGEMYFFRAYEYFKRLKQFGDFPIVTTCLPDDLATLTEACKRAPRNEVARFILEDLDKAIELLKGTNMQKTRINEDAARLFKSRVALYEGSWEKNFAGTAFVPGTAEWPGKDASYNKDFAFKAGSAEAEYNWFFDQAMAAAKIVADKHVGALTQNTGVVPGDDLMGAKQADIDAVNPYLAMFGSTDLEGYDEVLFWREFSKGLGIVNNIPVQAQNGNQARGTTRSMVEAFPMKNGLPIYAPGSGYKGDNTITDVRTDRDPRLFVFLKEPGQVNILISGNGSHAVPVEPVPAILDGSSEKKYTTGYALRKGNSYDQNQCDNGSGYVGVPVMRSVEALLNYMEASYERNGNIDATADGYWKAIRARHAGLDTDYRKTISNTDMSREAQLDWGAYTAGRIIDAELFNIRRERRLELMAEGFRNDDVYRWRSLDQMVTNGYHVEGFRIWGTPMESWYDATDLAEGVSPASLSPYLRPYEAPGMTDMADGYKWTMAQYLRPLPIKQFMLTAPDGATVALSPLYQNPYWPTVPDVPATK